MQQHKFSENKMNDLKKRGWSDMSKRLNAHMPVKQNALWKKRILLLLLALLLVLGGIRIGQSTWFNKRASIAFDNSSHKNINQPVINVPNPVMIKGNDTVIKKYTGVNDYGKSRDVGRIAKNTFGKNGEHNIKKENLVDLDEPKSKDEWFNELEYYQISQPSLKGAQFRQIEHVDLENNGVINSESSLFNSNENNNEFSSLNNTNDDSYKEYSGYLGQNEPILDDSLLVINEMHDSIQNDSVFAKANEFKADDEIIRPIKIKEKTKLKVYFLDIGAGLTATQSVNLAGYYYLGLNRLVKNKLLIGVQFGHSFLSLNDFITYNANITKPYSVTSQGANTLIETREYNEYFSVNRLGVSQLGVNLMYQATPKVALGICYFKNSVSHLYVSNQLYSQDFIENYEYDRLVTKTELNNRVLEKNKDLGRIQDVAEYRLKSYNSIEIKLDYAITKHINFSGMLSSSFGNPFVNNLNLSFAEYGPDFIANQMVNRINYLKFGFAYRF